MTRRTKIVPGPCKDVIEGKTANGGSHTVYFYFDNKYKPVDISLATRAIMHEYDEKERSVYRDYFTVNNGEIVLNLSARPSENKPEALGVDASEEYGE